ncbi:MTOR-associated protein MEAK7-like [Haliotis rubra]|uniref:MTOR-associated protein MEAK7-like n=1 Tax=Haliotis rubra TaxID=36100 RepID=UPI001EE4F666|nr:MTOR-associated protein MEAK7-like [Haliotis rubra]
MGASQSSDSEGSDVHFTDEEKDIISQMFTKISHGKKTISKEQLESYTGPVLGQEMSHSIFCVMELSEKRHQPDGGISLQQFLQCLSRLLRGSVTERSTILLYLATGGKSEATPQQLIKCVTMLIYSFARIAEKHVEYKSWVLHRSEEAFSRLALCLLEDLFHAGPDKDRGMGVPVVPDNTTFNQSQIEDCISKSQLFLQMFEQIFSGCFHVVSKDEEVAHHLTPRVPVAGCINWAKVKSILDFPSLIFLNSVLPPDKQMEWRFLYSNLVFGDSFTQLVQKITRQGPTVVIVRDKDGNVFGGYASQDLEFNPKFTGDAQCALFSLKPHYGVYTTTGYNDHYVYFNNHVQTLPNGLGMGGQFDYFGLWIDHTFNNGHSKAGPRCTTYGSPQLSGKPDFEVDVIEVWAVGPEKKIDDDDITDESRKKKSILDKDPEAQAMLTLIGKGPVSEGLREEDDTAGNPEHSKVVSLF